MISLIIFIGVVALGIYVGYSAGYCCGFDDGVLSEVKRRIDDERTKIKARDRK